MARIDLGFSCGEDWEAMAPTVGGARRCGACGEDVIDLSRLTRKEAERVVRGRDVPCVSFETDGDGHVVFRTDPRRAGALAIGAATLLAACSSTEPGIEIRPEPTTSAPVPAPFVMMPMAPGAPWGARSGLDDAAAGDRNDVDALAPIASAVARPHTRPSATPALTTHRRHAGRRPSIVSIRRDRNL